MDVARAEDQLNSLVEKRARGREEANASEMAWKESVRKHHAGLSSPTPLGIAAPPPSDNYSPPKGPGGGAVPVTNRLVVGALHLADQRPDEVALPCVLHALGEFDLAAAPGAPEGEAPLAAPVFLAPQQDDPLPTPAP